VSSRSREIRFKEHQSGTVWTGLGWACCLPSLLPFHPGPEFSTTPRRFLASPARLTALRLARVSPTGACALVQAHDVLAAEADPIKVANRSTTLSALPQTVKVPVTRSGGIDQAVRIRCSTQAGSAARQTNGLCITA